MACQLLQRLNTSRVGALAAPASRSAQLIAQAGAVPDVGPRPAAGYRCQAPAFLGEAATDGCSKRAGYLAEYTRPDSPAGHTVNSNSAHTSSGTWSRTVIGRADWLSGVKAAAVALYPRSNCAALFTVLGGKSVRQLQCDHCRLGVAALCSCVVERQGSARPA